MRRKLLTLTLLAVVMGIGFVGYLWWTAPRHRINWGSATKINKGMTRAEVEAILNVPPGVYCSGPTTGEYWRSWIGPEQGCDLMRESGGSEWVARDLTIYVSFDRDGRVQDTCVGFPASATLVPETWLDKVRRWLNL